MNLVPISVIKVIKEATKLENKRWKKTILTDSYGIESIEEIEGTKHYVNKFIPGYTWDQ